MRVIIKNIFILLFSSIFTEDIIHIPQYHDSQYSLNFTVIANLTNYLNLLSNNNSEIENKVIYSSYKELKEAKIAVLEGTIFKKFSENLNLEFQISEYKSSKEIVDSLKSKKIEAYITTLEEAQNLIMYNDELAYINIDKSENLEEYQYSFVANKENSKALGIFENQYRDYHLFHEANFNWNGFDESVYIINKTMKNGYNTDKIKVGLRMDDIPFSYINSKGEETGYTIYYIYRYFDNVELLEFKTNEELIEAVQNGTVNISCGYFSEKENLDKNYIDISFSYSQYKLTPVAVIRYENSDSSKVWKINKSIKDFKNKKFAFLEHNIEDIIDDSFIKLLNITNDKISKEGYLMNDVFILLLKEEVDAILVNKIMAEYYSKHFDKFTYFSESLSNDSYGFGFFNETLKDEFNEFLSNNYNEDKINEMINNWINNENYEIDKNLLNLEGTKGTIKYLLDYNKKPIAFLDNDIPKGIEFELLYKFAKEYGYKIKYGWTRSNEGTLGDDFDVYLGGINLNKNHDSLFDEIILSNPIYKSSTVLAVKTKNKKDHLTIQALDENYNYKSDNSIQLLTEVLYQEKNTTCIFPKEYDDTILINCSVVDFEYNINGTFTGVEFLDSSDLIQITYSTIKPNNFFNANLIFKDAISIIDVKPSDQITDNIIKTQETVIINNPPTETIKNPSTETIKTQETDINSDKDTNKNSDTGNNNDKDKKGEDNKSELPINRSGNSSDKGGLSIGILIGIIAGAVAILLIIILICVVRRLKNKAENPSIKVADNSNVSNEIAFSGQTTK